jgi:hypothetical protein
LLARTTGLLVSVWREKGISLRADDTCSNRTLGAKRLRVTKFSLGYQCHSESLNQYSHTPISLWLTRSCNSRVRYSRVSRRVRVLPFEELRSGDNTRVFGTVSLSGGSSSRPGIGSSHRLVLQSSKENWDSVTSFRKGDPGPIRERCSYVSADQ